MGTTTGRGRTRAAATAVVAALVAGATAALGGPVAAAAPGAPAHVPAPQVGPRAPGPATAAHATLPRSLSPRAEAARVDAVRTPKLAWYRCYDGAQCATVKVPLDYDRPAGPTVELALLRRPARDRKHRIGSLFVNPGGPGGSATEFAAAADGILSPKLLDRFDVVGMDPRGIGASTRVACLTPQTQATALAGYGVAFPLGAKQEKAWRASDAALGRACSANALATSMSTAEVARDMELMRRAVGDAKLTYLGFSYGTYLGQVYASMFPTRFRALAVDGVLDPVAWAGTSRTAAQPLEARLDSASGAWKALREILRRCDRLGGSRCSFAPGDPTANLATIAARLKAHPVELTDPEEAEVLSITYADLVGLMLGALYDPAGYALIDSVLSSLWVLTEPPNPAARSGAARAAATHRAERTLTEALRAGVGGRPAWTPGAPGTGTGTVPGHGFPYDNGLDAFASVTCTDSRETTRSAQFPGFAAAADRKAPYFGRAWLWGSSVCAGDVFTGQDEDAYTGPFDRKTKARVLYVGNDYDPATNYRAAVSASKRQPGARLLRSKSWGHTAYGSSSCVTKAVDTYLVSKKLPKKGKVCTGDVQPFEEDEGDWELRANARRQAAFSTLLPTPFPRRCARWSRCSRSPGRSCWGRTTTTRRCPRTPPATSPSATRRRLPAASCCRSRTCVRGWRPAGGPTSTTPGHPCPWQARPSSSSAPTTPTSATTGMPTSPALLPPPLR